MTPFLQHVAADLFRKTQGDLSRTLIVFPSKRAGLYVNEYLLDLAGESPLWAPRYTTISELFGSTGGQSAYLTTLKMWIRTWSMPMPSFRTWLTSRK